MTLRRDGKTPHPTYDQLPMMALSLPFSPEALQARFGEGWNTYNGAQQEAVGEYQYARARVEEVEYPNGRNGERQKINPLFKLALAIKRAGQVADRTANPELRVVRVEAIQGVAHRFEQWEASRPRLSSRV